MSRDEDKKLHHEVGYVGLRAQATAVGLLQLCIELRAAGVLSEDSVSRIKETIAREIAFSGPRSIPRDEYGRDVRNRLDRLFKGQEPVGAAGALSFGAEDAD